MIASPNRKSRKGATLTEVVAAIALVALCVGGLISILVQSAGLLQTVDYNYVVINLAKNRLERIREIRRDRGYSAIPDTWESNTIIDRNGVQNPNGDFMRTTVVDPAYAAGLTKVTVSVKYKKKGLFNPVSIDLVTLISPTT